MEQQGKQKRSDRVYQLTDDLDFGKHKGKMIKYLIENETQYMRWCIENIEWFNVSTDVLSELEEVES